MSTRAPRPRTTGRGTGNGAANPSVITELRSRYDILTHSQKRIAETIVNNPSFVAFATVDKFAARLGVSPWTIMRFAYRMGSPATRDSRSRYASWSSKGCAPTARAARTSRLISATPSSPSRCGTTSRFSTALRRSFDPDDLDRAVDLIVKAERVAVVGGVTAYGIAYYAAVTLDRVRPGVGLLSGKPVPAGPLVDMGAGDVLLAFSFPRMRARPSARSRPRGIAASVSLRSPTRRSRRCVARWTC